MREQASALDLKSKRCVATLHVTQGQGESARAVGSRSVTVKRRRGPDADGHARDYKGETRCWKRYAPQPATLGNVADSQRGVVVVAGGRRGVVTRASGLRLKREGD